MLNDREARRNPHYAQQKLPSPGRPINKQTHQVHDAGYQEINTHYLDQDRGRHAWLDEQQHANNDGGDALY